MGLAPKQRARLSTQKEVHSLRWCLSHFPTAPEMRMARQKVGGSSRRDSDGLKFCQ